MDDLYIKNNRNKEGKEENLTDTTLLHLFNQGVMSVYLNTADKMKV